MTELTMSSVAQLHAALNEITVYHNVATARMMLNLLPLEALRAAILDLDLLLDVARAEEETREAETERVAVR
jgi:hypothetical protein